MIKFNNVQITASNTLLLINAEVIDNSYFTNVYIDKIIIDSNTTYNPSGPSSEPVYEYTLLTDVKNVDLSINTSDITDGIPNKFFIVYVITKGDPNINTPSYLRNNILSTGVYSKTFFKQRVLYYLGQLTNKCDVPKDFINFLLQDKAIEYAITTGNIYDAVNLFNRFIRASNV